MAIYHLSMQNIGRNDGRSAVACASYRAGETLHDERLGKTFTFPREDRVVHTEIIAPSFAPEWVSDRGQLWNSIEASEKRKDARLAREIECALPHELALEQQQELVRTWVEKELKPLGLVSDVCIHQRPGAGERNDHVHIMTSPRRLELDGTWSKKKDANLNKAEQLDLWRASWAMFANEALLKGGHDQRIDHRSYKDRGKETTPTIHVGFEHHAIERRGGFSWRINWNRQVRTKNRSILIKIGERMIAKFRQATEGLTRNQADPVPAERKEERAPAPITTMTTEPTKPITMPLPETVDAEALAEKKKKAAQLQAAIQRSRGGGIG
jgi:ATP-dependent exoDNAse (exonuclease V) alpha subunit